MSKPNEIKPAKNCAKPVSNWAVFPTALVTLSKSTDKTLVIDRIVNNLCEVGKCRDNLYAKFDPPDIETLMKFYASPTEKWEPSLRALYKHALTGACLNPTDTFVAPSRLPMTLGGAKSLLALLRGLWTFYSAQHAHEKKNAHK